MRNQKLKGNLLLLFTAVVWGASFIAQSKGVEQVSPVAFIGIRSLLGSAVLLPVILFLDRRRKKKGREVMGWNKPLWLGGILCGLFLCAATTLQTMGMVETSPGKAGFITALYMVIIPLCQIFRGRKPSSAVLVSVLLAVGGMYLMCIGGSFTLNRGDLLIFACAFFFAGHILVIDHFSPMVDGIKLSCVQFFVCGLINTCWMLLFEEVTLGPILQSWMSIGYAGVFSCGVAYTLQIVGQKYTDPTSASIIMSLESVFATLFTVLCVALGWDLTGGQLTLKELCGCALMFGAILLVQLPDLRQKKNT
ncbi:MAG: DMT family transporter [Clostridia bacterium]|nr:DMT family transporter [Clostridia bacterium]